MNSILSSFLTPQGLIALLVSLVIVTPYLLFFFRKGIIHQLVREAGLATKSDLDGAINGLRAEFKADINNLRRDMEALRTELKGDIKELRTEMDALRTELKGEIKDLRTDMDTFRKDMQRDRNELRKDMERDMDTMRKDMQRDRDTLRKELIAGIQSKKSAGLQPVDNY